MSNIFLCLSKVLTVSECRLAPCGGSLFEQTVFTERHSLADSRNWVRMATKRVGAAYLKRLLDVL